MNRKFIPLFTGDIACALVALYIPGLLFLTGMGFGLEALNPVWGICILSTLVLAGFSMEVYSFHRRYPWPELALRLILVVLLSFAGLTLVHLMGVFTTQELYTGGVALSTAGVLQFVWHLTYRRISFFDAVSNKVIILGNGAMARGMGTLFESEAEGYHLLGYVSCEAEKNVINTKGLVGCEENLLQTAKDLGANKVVVALGERRGVFPLAQLLSCKLSGIEVLDAPSFYERVTGKLLIENITPSWFIFSDGFKITPLVRIAKRVLDLLVASVAFLLVLPLFPLIALAIKLESPGPIFFTQVRVGEGDEDFVIMKFRTMRNDAEKKSGAVWSQENDPRITKVGKFLRKVRFDELPQLINVLRGDMSMVGPRPERPEFVAKLKEVIPYYSERHYVKPGLTGWAQIRYPYGSSVEDAIEKLRYDLFYIKNLSVLFDLQVIFRTVSVVLLGKGGR